MSDYKAIKESLHGCSNHSCVIKKPVGMGTNGQCHCLDDRMKRQRFAYIRNEEIKDLQQKLLASQASELRVREAVTEYVTAVRQRALHPDIQMRMDKALSTPPNTAELEAHVESEIERRFEKVGEVGIDSSYEELPNFTDLYAKKG